MVITSSPDAHVAEDDWELRWTANKLCNEKYKGKFEKIRKNPFQFWRHAWQKDMTSKLHKQLSLLDCVFLNIDRKKVRRFDLLAI